jgi:ABC-type glycerol-3-phosphate transport system substrate-binding protein
VRDQPNRLEVPVTNVLHLQESEITAVFIRTCFARSTAAGKLFLIVVACAAAAATAPSATAGTVSIDFDGLADGTVINNAYASQGVTFKAVGYGGGENVYARSSSQAASGPNVVAMWLITSGTSSRRPTSCGS